MTQNPHVPYATDGTDYLGALRYYCISELKNFIKYTLIFAPLFLSVYVTGIEYFLWLTLIGGMGIVFRVIFIFSRAFWITKCWRVLRQYPLEFYGSVEKVNMMGTKYIIRLTEGGKKSPMMRAKEAKTRSGWPKGIADGLWFAGDELFGGAAIVPGSGELLFMQPEEWKLLAEQRQNAGIERTRAARRAGIKRRVSFQ